MSERLEPNPHTFLMLNTAMDGLFRALQWGAAEQARADKLQESLDNANEAYDRLANEAMVDHLTGLPNRQVLEDTFWGLQNEHPTDRRTNEADRRAFEEEHYLLYLDLDNFKRFNDEFGHDAGDDLLQDFGRVLKATVRKRDLPVRLGGEEFAVVLPRTGKLGAEVAAEKIREAVQETTQVTLSVGIAELDLARSLKANLRNADDALYVAKHRGRNQSANYDELTDSEKQWLSSRSSHNHV